MNAKRARPENFQHSVDDVLERLRQSRDRRPQATRAEIGLPQFAVLIAIKLNQSFLRARAGLRVLPSGEEQRAARREHLDERCRRGADRGLDDDSIEASKLVRRIEAVGENRLGVCSAVGGQPARGFDGERLEPLEAYDLACELRERRRAIAGPRPDLQHPMAAADLERLEPSGKFDRTRHGLPAADRQREIAIRKIAKAIGRERLPRGRLDRAQDRKIAQARLTQRQQQRRALLEFGCVWRAGALVIPWSRTPPRAASPSGDR